MLTAGKELEDPRVVGEMSDLGPVRGGQASDQRRQRSGLGAALFGGKCAVAAQRGAEGLRPAVGVEVALRGVDDLQRACLGLGRSVAPRRDAVPAENGSDRLRVALLDIGDVQTELKPGPPPGNPHHAIAEDLFRQRLAVRRSGQGDTGVGVQVIDMGRVNKAVHGGVDRRCRTAAAVQAVVERADHFILALDAGVDVDQCAHAIQPQHGQSLLGQRSQVSTGPLDPQQLHRLARHRVGFAALGRCVAAGVVGVLRVGAQPVGPCDQFGDCVIYSDGHFSCSP